VIESAPADLDERVAWFDRVSQGLVLLEEYPLESVRTAVRAIHRSIQEHLDASEGAVPDPSAAVLSPSWGPIRRDHDRFRISLEQLRWFLEVVEHEDHGGNRQALGQYGRLLTESFRVHRDLERALSRAASGPAPRHPSKSN
jgi:hypothetical protein